jgi:hypothetical protein
MSNKSNSLIPIVILCPTCGEKFLLSRNLPSENAILFSDGFFVDEENWRTPGIIGCVTCELGFFSEKGRIIAEPDLEEFQKHWSHLKRAEAPSASALILELRTRRKMDLKEEKIIRHELWYAVNHTEKGQQLILQNARFHAFFKESLVRLENIFSIENREELLLKAEINRQLGNFDKCIGLLSSENGSLAGEIREAASNKNDRIFQLTTF